MATYTTPDQVDLPAVAKIYGLEEPQLAPLAGGAANSSFHLSAGSAEFVLTILDNHDKESAALLAKHSQSLFALRVPTTEVIPAVDGALLGSAGDQLMILKRWVSGAVRDPLPVPLLSEAGRILGRLHDLSVDSPGLEDVPRGTRRLSAKLRAEIPGFKDSDFADWLTDRLDLITANEADREIRPTLVHGDLFADNVIVRADGGLTILDWETLSVDDPLLDLGMAAVGLAREDGVLNRERLRALVAGYREVCPLVEEDVAALPVEIEHAALIIAFHRYYRHHVRFPDPSKAALHLEMIEFADSVGAGALQST